MTEFDWKRRKDLAQNCLRRLTFELRGRNRDGAWPARRMMTASASRAKCHAGGGPRSSEGLGLTCGERQLQNDLALFDSAVWPEAEAQIELLRTLWSRNV